MDWLKQIIENTEINDNKIDTEKLMTSINGEFSKYAISIDEYNKVQDKLNIANEEKENFKNTINNKDKTIIQTTIKKLLAQNNADRKYEDILTSQFDISKVGIKDDGTIDESKLLEQVKSIKNEHKKLFNSSKYVPGDSPQTIISNTNDANNFINIIESNKIRK